MSGEPEAFQDKIARLTRERDEMAAQASACTEEVDRVRVEIGAIQAEVERLTQICTGLGLDLSIAEGERDDARMGEEIWALRCGVVLGRSPIPDAPADLGRLPAETFWRAAGVQDRVRWDDRTFDEQQRWAYAEAACIEKARSQAPEVQSLVAEIQSLRSALQDSERKRVEDIATTREACASICDARAAYFDRSPGCEAAAASYRATAQEIRALRPSALIARESADAEHI